MTREKRLYVLVMAMATMLLLMLATDMDYMKSSMAQISPMPTPTFTPTPVDTAVGTITIEKQTGDGEGPAFGFTGDLGEFSLDPGASTTFEALAPSSYTITELVPAGWNLAAIGCSTSGPGALDVDFVRDADDNLTGANIHLGPDQHVTCGFSNQPLVDISLTKTAQPAAVDEPGDQVLFDLVVTNDGLNEATLDSLTDSAFDLGAHCADAAGTALAPGEVYTCSFTEFVAGNAGTSHTNKATAVAFGPGGTSESETAEATVTVADVPPVIEVTKEADTGYVLTSGESVVYRVEVRNDSVATDPVTVQSLLDDLYGELTDAGNLALVDTTCTAGTIAPGDTYGCEFTVLVQTDQLGGITDTVTATATDDEGNEVSDVDEATVIVVPPSAVTSSALCEYDVDPDLDGAQFRLVFTPDLKDSPNYKLPASNPGQHFYNVFYAGSGPADLEVTVPYPFVTRGAVPVHAYGALSVTSVDGLDCFVPDPASEAWSSQAQITLEDYVDPGYGGTAKLSLSGVPVPNGFVYLTIHLDYGLKGTTGYMPDGSANALDFESQDLVIPTLFGHTFAVSGNQTDNQTVQNANVFKEIRGIAGLVTDGDGNALPGVQVEVTGPDAVPLESVITDGDGWFLFAYRHKGRAALYTVHLPAYGLSHPVELRANGFAEADFEVRLP